MNQSLLHPRSAARILGLLALLSVVACNGDSGGDDPSCEPGTESCPCDNGACSAGLTCLSNVCVQGAAGSGGIGGSSPQGGSGGTNAGGTSTGGASGGTGGQSVGGAGGNPAGGAGSGGVTTGGSGGVSGSGGTGGATCENTQTDPMNCGQCGRVCKVTAYNLSNADCPPVGIEDQCCSGGACVPYLGECVEQSAGFASCDQYCGSIGEVCVESGCSGSITWAGWFDPEDCQMYAGIDERISAGCDSTIDFSNPNTHAVRCCCTDTQP